MNNSLKEHPMLQEPERINYVLSIIFMIFFFSMSTLCLYKTNVFSASSETYYILIIPMTILVSLELIKRSFYFIDGLIKKSESERSLSEIVKDSFSFNTLSIIIIILCLCVVILVTLIVSLYDGKMSFLFYEFKNSTLSISDKKYLFLAIIFGFCFSYLFLDAIKINECRAHKLQIFYDLGGLDYGSSMACSFFFGYLKIILPPDGKENEGLVGRIGNFEDNHNVTIPVKKLFILIPASLYIPSDFKVFPDGWLEVIENNLKYDVINLNRAGVHKRQYQNTIYKLIPGGIGSKKTPLHLVTEGASPLLTFFEVQQYSHRYSAIYREFKKEIIKSFYRTLQNLLNDNPDCRDVCELVYYEDYDANGVKVNPAKILYQRIIDQMYH